MTTAIYHFVLFSIAFIASIGHLYAEVMPATSHFSQAEPGEKYPVGKAAASYAAGNRAFSKPIRSVSGEQKLDFAVGKGFFRKLWVSSPSATTASDGLGPLYNARSCASCHIRNGRGHTPDDNDNAVSIFLRLSIPPQNNRQQALIDKHQLNVIPEPVYGKQLQSFAVRGVRSEGRLSIRYEALDAEFPDGEKVSLRKPHYTINHLNYGDMHHSVMMSPRVAPPMIGLGFLEAISEEDIVSLADEDDSNADGITGKANRVWSQEHAAVKVGRFGYKAGIATLNEQNQDAFSGDIGISTPLRPKSSGDCTSSQTQCLNAPHGADAKYDHLEAPAKVMQTVSAFTHYLNVPVRKHTDSPDILAGKKHFYNSGCTSCHHPSYKTGELPGFPMLSGQHIWPYSDFLLHDMGEGLADHRPEGKAGGREWKTPPLWGISHTQSVNKRAGYLHDGRARNLQEAILWHGGEAEQSKQNYIRLEKQSREQLLQFLNTL